MVEKNDTVVVLRLNCVKLQEGIDQGYNGVASQLFITS